MDTMEATNVKETKKMRKTFDEASVKMGMVNVAVKNLMAVMKQNGSWPLSRKPQVAGPTTPPIDPKACIAEALGMVGDVQDYLDMVVLELQQGYEQL